MNEITLGNQNVLSVPPGHPTAGVNYLELTGRADRRFPNRGAFLMTRSAYQDLGKLSNQIERPSAARGKGLPQCQLIMKGQFGGGLDIPVTIIGATPFSLATSFKGGAGGRTFGNDNKDTVLVHVTVDLAWTYDYGAFDGYWNIQVPGYHYNQDDEPVFEFASLNEETGSIPFTWEEIVTNLSQADDFFQAGNPTWQPRNLDLRNIRFGDLVDYLANLVYGVPGRRWITNGNEDVFPSFGIAPLDDGHHWIYAPDQVSDENAAMLSAAEGSNDLVGVNARDGGGVDQRANNRYPKVIRVHLPRAERVTIYRPATNTESDDVGNNFNAWEWVLNYIDPAAGANAWGFEDIYCHHYVKVTKEDTVEDYENSDMVAFAQDMAKRRIAWLKAVPETRRYKGIWPFHPDGRIRRIRWTSDLDGAITELFFNEQRPPSATGAPPAPDDGLPAPLFGAFRPGPVQRGLAPILFPDTGTGYFAYLQTQPQVVTVQFGINYDFAGSPDLGGPGSGGLYAGAIAYPGRINQEDSPFPPSSGVLNAACIVISNEETELGNSDNVQWIAACKGIIGTITGYYKGDDDINLPVVRIGGPVYFPCGDHQFPLSVINNTFVWDRSKPSVGDVYGGDVGLSMFMLTRPPDASIGTLTFFYREVRLESCGRWYYVGPEGSSDVTLV